MQSNGMFHGLLDHRKITISLLSPFQDRRTDIVAYRCTVCSRKGRVHWIKEDYMQKFKNLKQERDISLFRTL